MRKPKSTTTAAKARKRKPAASKKVVTTGTAATAAAPAPDCPPCEAVTADQTAKVGNTACGCPATDAVKPTGGPATGVASTEPATKVATTEPATDVASTEPATKVATTEPATDVASTEPAKVGTVKKPVRRRRIASTQADSGKGGTMMLVGAGLLAALLLRPK